mmetsp:Transcript_11080/g.18101  ORF Transcript_11080/g.18101 Transcript_11080/m.18101 type:complete len:196 (-) Transcript_11080:260-847(-)|eukprot:CAMPEP_0114431936 /NCGR_PEP_ID=MMETSP0103-20121206/10882_1 /TAXON_ID=37642 ORGANISM="Paraphysomonas imperforata, Strain PA2" /NCGR_SAMPLE_ID=MMETSP0103 /ASSEMBLY_ACC=CAM_ASM_000201 /LENGTH=195 /DNA_ID=CAMNT_0001601567 /DNA_START=38 /DNA_END=625 /DNA_ORIENTATION=-
MPALNDPNCAELMAQALEIQVKSLNEQIELLRGYVPAASTEEETGSKKRKKKEVDPNRPKRSRSAYQMFIMDVLPKLKEQHPELTQRDIMSMGAKQWSTCPAKKKEELEKAAAKEKANYEVVIANYRAGLTVEGTSLSSSSSSSSTSAAPVKAKKSHSKKAAEPSVVPEPVVPAPSTHEEKKRKKDKKKKKSKEA